MCGMIHALKQETNGKKITEEDCKKYPWHKKLIGQILRLLAPLM